MPKRTLYGWLRGEAQWCLGRSPPDSPTGPFEVFDSIVEAEAAAKAYRATIIWCGDAAKMQKRAS